MRLLRATRTRRMRGPSYLLATTAFVLAAATPAHAGDAQVRIDVDLASATAAAPSPLYGYSGNIWLTPSVFGLGVADRIVGMPHLGVTRVSLGDQLLQHATSLADLKRRLQYFELNDYLRRTRAAGGELMLILDGTPRWISSNRSRDIVVGPNQPRFRMSPPADMLRWAEVVEAIVQHFNGTLSLDAMYEAWNEPNYYYLGTVDQFFAQYKHSVLGARRADPAARVGGPGISEFTGVATAGTPADTEAQKVDLLTKTYDQQYLYKQFIEYAARTSLPELGLTRLPVDFLSWHAFYANPTGYYRDVLPFMRQALKEQGYRRETPIINSEWNIAAVPPYPEGDINATHVNAAHGVTSLIAMREAGVARQGFQMYVDPGTAGYYGGMYTASGVPRANFHAFQLASMLLGQELRSASSDAWVRATAFRNGQQLQILVTSLKPTPKMLQATEDVLVLLRSGDFTRSLVDADLVLGIVRGQGLPPDKQREADAIAADSARRVQTDVTRAARRGEYVDVELNIVGLTGAPTQAAQWRVDSTHANVWPHMALADQMLEPVREHELALPALTRQALIDSGLTPQESDQVVARLQSGQSLDQALSGITDASRKAAARSAALRTMQDYVAHATGVLADIEALPGAGLVEEPLSWPAQGPLRIRIEANSVWSGVLTVP